MLIICLPLLCGTGKDRLPLNGKIRRRGAVKVTGRDPGPANCGGPRVERRRWFSRREAGSYSFTASIASSILTWSLTTRPPLSIRLLQFTP